MQCNKTGIKCPFCLKFHPLAILVFFSFIYQIIKDALLVRSHLCLSPRSKQMVVVVGTLAYYANSHGGL